MKGLEYAIKFGHFNTIVGYEVVPAPGNFFYSHSLTMFNAEPFTHTGVLGSWNAFDDLTVFGGWTAGWNTGFESNNDGGNFIGGASAQVTEDVNATYIATAGNFGSIGDEAYSHSLVIETDLADRLSYVFQSDLKRVNTVRRDIIGVNQYLFYELTEEIDAGARIEWLKIDGHSYNAMTFGTPIRLTDNVTVRPEVRHDWIPHLRFDRTTFGVDAIIAYN